MKVLMFSSGYYPDSCGGVETIVKELSEGLLDSKCEVTVLYSKEEFEKDEVYTCDGVKVIKMRSCICRKIDNKFKTKINRYLQMYNIFNKKKIKKIIQSEAPDVIHVHMPRILSYSVYKAARECRIPTVATLHECYSLWNYNPFLPMEYMLDSTPTILCKLLRNCQKRATKDVKYILSPIYDLIEQYRNDGYFRNAIGIEVQNALRFDLKEAYREIEMKKERLKNSLIRRYLYIGRLIQFKGLEVTLEAFHNWNVQNVELHIAGDGPLRYLVEQYSKIDKRIKYHGFVKKKDKEEIYRSTDVLLFNVSEIETFGLVCLEGYYYGIPVIGSDTKAIKRIIDDGKTGTIVKEISIHNIQIAMDKYIHYEDWYQQINNCYEKIKQYEYQHFIQKNLKIYNKVIEKR